MTRSALAIQQIGIGTPLTPAAMTVFPGSGAGNGFSVAIGGNTRTMLMINNASAGSRTFTIINNAANKKDGVTLPSQTITLANATGVPGIIWLGPLDYMDTNGQIYIDVDTAASVTAAAIQLPANFQ